MMQLYDPRRTPHCTPMFIRWMECQHARAGISTNQILLFTWSSWSL